MNRWDKAWIGGLVALAAFVWLRDRAWFGTAEDTLPVLSALPLMVWLGGPWRFQASASFAPDPRLLALAGLLLVVGIGLDVTLLAAGAWTAALYAWLGRRVAPEDQPRLRRLLPLALLAFPWVTLDFQPLGWWFRLSGAWSAERLFDALGFKVSREGVKLLVQGLPVSVDASCSGLKALQAMLIAGVVLGLVMLGRGPRYWLNLVLLAPLAWLANTARILAICVAAMTWGSGFAMGLFHTWGGLAVLVLMFGGCWALFRLQQAPVSP